ncbi:MAG: DASH family cryptochrome [Alcanivoracaceae bacterium]
MTTIVWLRQDLRIADNALWQCAAERGEPVLALYVLPRHWLLPGASGLDRLGAAKAGFLAQCLEDTRDKLGQIGVPLVDVVGTPDSILVQLAGSGQAHVVTAEAQAPEEQAWLERLQKQGIAVSTAATQSLFTAREAMPDGPTFPGTFSRFRRPVENDASLVPQRPMTAPLQLKGVDDIPPPLHQLPPAADCLQQRHRNRAGSIPAYPGGETAALCHLHQYLADVPAVRQYKETRNQLAGTNFSSGLSGYLSAGALSARTAWHALLDWEVEHGACTGSYWLRFELLWREFFHWSLRHHGTALFRYRGLDEDGARQHDALTSRQRSYWSRWCRAETGLPWIDASLVELMETGWISNRGRQLLASFLIYEMGLDWRWGAEFFQHYLLDDDVASNWGNWAYIAGVGHDARGGRQFAILEQFFRHDPAAAHVHAWLPHLAGLSSEQIYRIHCRANATGTDAAMPSPMLLLDWARTA